MARDLTEFNLLYTQATEMAKAFPESQFKTIASILVIIGWLVTASTAQQFIHANAAAAIPATIFAFSTFVLFKALWIRLHFKRCQALYAQLLRLVESQELSPTVIETLKPHPLIPLTFFAVNLIVCSAAVVVVWLVAR